MAETRTRLTCTTHCTFKDFQHSDPEWAEKYDAWMEQHEAQYIEDL